MNITLGNNETVSNTEEWCTFNEWYNCRTGKYALDIDYIFDFTKQN